MNSNDLFSFLEDGGDDHETDGKNDMPVDPTPVPSKFVQKRKAESSPPPVVDEPNGHTADDSLNGSGPSPKKPRLSSPQPLVLDDFETEAKREVAASAGLTGNATEEGSRLELRHQVRIRSMLYGHVKNHLSL